LRIPTYADIVRWDDTALINWRRQAKAELDRNPRDDALQRCYDASTVEVANRTRANWGMAPAARRAS
jgi:hypothetical protein